EGGVRLWLEIRLDGRVVVVEGPGDRVVGASQRKRARGALRRPNGGVVGVRRVAASRKDRGGRRVCQGGTGGSPEELAPTEPPPDRIALSWVRHTAPKTSGPSSVGPNFER